MNEKEGVDDGMERNEVFMKSVSSGRNMPWSSGTSNSDTKAEQGSTEIEEPSDESDIVEHDVKVCDICGDAGREDMLAICSRCSDGAEHTYCMRKMLRKVPGSNWMCEECKFAEEEINSKKQVSVTEPKRLGLGLGKSAKRVAENVEVGSSAKRQALETSIGSPRSSSPVKAASLSREPSFKNSDKVERLKPSQHTRSANDIQETAHSLVPAPRLQTHKGPLFKSKSFNASKPKVKLVDEVVPQNQKGVIKDHASVDTAKDKDRSKLIQKSMSFKSPNSARSSASESKVKMLSPRISHTLDSKGSKSMKERNAFDRKNLPKLDRAASSLTSSSTVSTPKADLATRGESSLLSFAGNSRDLRVQTEGKSSTSKATGNLTRRPVEVSVTSVGVSSTTEQKSKDDASFTSEKPSSSVDDGFPRPVEPYQCEKTKEAPLRSRSSVMSNSRSTFCQKCKEIGHSAEFCPSGSSEASGIDASSRSCREEGLTHGVSKLKEAINAAFLRKPEIQRRKRTVDQVDEIFTDLNCHEQAPPSSYKSKIAVFGEVQQAVLRNPTSDSSHTDAPKSCVTSHPSPQLVKMLAIPEYEYVWRGCFEVNGSGSLMEVCGGIQAHLSTCVSPRVPETVRKFPQKLSLNEVPRLSTWPAQFYDGGAKEDNIALYFFAKDLESYERNYKSLLDGMIKNDLALKGTFEGVELLIFPSNQLPENSQRWNMLFFLWGVFRARRVNSSDSSNQSNIGGSDRMASVEKKVRNDVTDMSETLCSHNGESAECERCGSKSSEDCNEKKRSGEAKYTSDAEKMRSSSSSPDRRGSDGEKKDECCEKKVLEVFGGWKAKDASVEEKICVEDCEEKVIPEDLGATMSTRTERRFFPVDPRRPNSSSAAVGWSDHQFRGGAMFGFPNLELALGAETKPPPSGGRPFSVGRGIDIDDDDDRTVEDEPASLSLSLSFPMMANKDQPPQPSKPVSKPPPPVNTSLLLFGGFPDK